MSGVAAEIPDALRLGAADALERGLRFVDAHGGEFARLFARALLGAAPTSAVLELVSRKRHAGGGFSPLGLVTPDAPGLAELPGNLRGVLEALVVCADLAALASPLADAAADLCEELQLPDGSWGDPEAPGDPLTRLFATGLLAGLLGRSTAVRPHVLVAAGSFLGGLWSPDQVETGGWPAVAAFGTFFSNVPHELSDEALQWCGRELERGFRTGRFEASACVRVLLLCDALALPGAALAPAALLAKLLGEQAVDGGFAELAGGGPGERVAASLDAMHGIIRLCRSDPFGPPIQESPPR